MSSKLRLLVEILFLQEKLYPLILALFLTLFFFSLNCFSFNLLEIPFLTRKFYSLVLVPFFFLLNFLLSIWSTIYPYIFLLNEIPFFSEKNYLVSNFGAFSSSILLFFTHFNSLLFNLVVFSIVFVCFIF